MIRLSNSDDKTHSVIILGDCLGFGEKKKLNEIV